MKYLNILVGIVFFGGIGIYCFDGSNSDGGRAVAAVIACMFYIRQEAILQEARHDRLMQIIFAMRDAKNEDQYE